MTEPNPEQPNPEQPNSEQPSFEPIVVSYKLTADEYAHYAAAVARRGRSRWSFYIFVAVVFLTIPVALFFCAIAAQSLDDSEAVELAGYAAGLDRTIAGGGDSEPQL
jgi:hypothetical protein